MSHSARRILVAAFTGCALLLGACGGETAMPKSEFVEKYMDLAADDLTPEQLELAVDALREFASCIYDAIEDDAELVNSIDDVDGEHDQLSPEIEARTSQCSATAPEAINADTTASDLDE